MADINNKNEGNVPGKFFTDDQCISCDACCGVAPDFFVLNEDSISIVIRQPQTKEEENLCIEALESCPVDAIGIDDSHS